MSFGYQVLGFGSGGPGGVGDQAVEWLILSGGGGSGNFQTGGGGAGGYRTNYASAGSTFIAEATYNVVVGAGGAGQNGPPVKGNDSSVIGTGISITSNGGGGSMFSSDAVAVALRAGGSGAGGPGRQGTSANGVGGVGNSPSITPVATEVTTVQGFDGGTGNNTSYPGQGGGGGGGASEVGYAAPSGDCGNGGDGSANAISGTSITYGGGGGGGGSPTAPFGDGGAGGGGNGNNGDGTATRGDDGVDGLGGGSGGSPDAGILQASGGDGVVFLRLSDDGAAAATVTNADSTSTNVGGSGETVIKWLVDGSIVMGL